MHTDEAVNAYLTGELLAGQPFHYDPRDRHGPALFILAAPLAKCLGANKFSDLAEVQLRLVPVLAGSATILLLGTCVEMFGFIACLVAALLFAFAPLPVYYSRYFIHETLFLAATLGLISSGWHAWQKKSVAAAAAAGLCAALMLACKETCVIHFFALACAGFAWWAVNRTGAPSTSPARTVRDQTPTPSENAPDHQQAEPVPGAPDLKTILMALAVCLATVVLLCTWFGRNWKGLGDLFQAIPTFAARAGGQGHEKPFAYYFHLLDPMVVLSIVAVAGVYAAICEAVSQPRRPAWLLIIYGALVFVIYSAIPYKTPWLALNLWLSLALACGFGVAAFWEQIKKPAGHWAIVAAGIFLLATLAAQTKVLVFDEPAGEKNPFAYAHTGEDLLRLAPRLEQLAREDNLPQPRIAVVAADPWPLPWYLRKFSQVGFWQPSQNPGAADFFITSPEAAAKLGDLLKNFRPEYFGVRPEVLVIMWVPLPDQKLSEETMKP